MSEHPLMALLLDHNSFLGEAESVENEIMPLDEQLNFTTGDVAILAAANTGLEQDFAVVRAVDAEQHAETWPDWEERLLKSFVLCEIFSRSDPEISLGWVNRIKLLPIKQYRYKELKSWRKKGFPDDPPEWIMKYYRKYTDALSERAPNVVPRAVTCPHCGKRNVELVVTRRLEYKGRAGLMKLPAGERHVPITDPDVTSSHVAILRCSDCKATADLTDDEWELPNISN